MFAAAVAAAPSGGEGLGMNWGGEQDHFAKQAFSLDTPVPQAVLSARFVRLFEPTARWAERSGKLHPLDERAGVLLSQEKRAQGAGAEFTVDEQNACLPFSRQRSIMPLKTARGRGHESAFGAPA